ncbi:DUF3231 family protein [Desulfosporosinus sp. OT]|uniref:DUF3231 family protein n=1 Tax=Desulfosporosinus sp. OT TaxID=913865 RepID=UPI00058BB138|nr:DUF3231 family protein [Desulfosporosinus sp. OT]
MLFQTTIAMARIILVYGLALTNSARKDVVLALSRRLMAEIIEFSKDGVDLLIENGWLERVQETANRQELIH